MLYERSLLSNSRQNDITFTLVHAEYGYNFSDVARNGLAFIINFINSLRAHVSLLFCHNYINSYNYSGINSEDLSLLNWYGAANVHEQVRFDKKDLNLTAVIDYVCTHGISLLEIFRAVR